MEAFQASVFRIQVNPSLIGLLQVVANVNKLSSLEGVAELADFTVGCNESCEPVVCNTDGGDLLSLAAVFEAGLSKNSNLLDCKVRLHIRVWRWEDVSAVKEDKIDSFDFAFVDAYGASSININMDVIDIVNAIALDVAGLALSVSFVVGGDDVHLLAELRNTN